MKSLKKRELKNLAKDIYNKCPMEADISFVTCSESKSEMSLVVAKPYTSAYQVMFFNHQAFVGFGQAVCLPTDKWNYSEGKNRAEGKCRSMIIRKVYQRLLEDNLIAEVRMEKARKQRACLAQKLLVVRTLIKKGRRQLEFTEEMIRDLRLAKFEIPVNNCARCGGDHTGVEFSPFTSEPDFENYTHWGMCPKLGEPIQLAIFKKEEEPVKDDTAE